MEIRLSNTDADTLRAAICAVLTEQRAEMPASTVGADLLLGRLPTSIQLQAGAEQSLKEEADDFEAAEYFQSLLELGYLVASADGLAEEERDALAHLVESVTNQAADYEALQVHFDDLDTMSDALGRRERLGRVAANLETKEQREEAISFAALIAIADGVLAQPEAEVLFALGEHLSFGKDAVLAVIDQVKNRIQSELERSPG
jgi:tellurite resistance protein